MRTSFSRNFTYFDRSQPSRQRDPTPPVKSDSPRSIQIMQCIIAMISKVYIFDFKDINLTHETETAGDLLFFFIYTPGMGKWLVRASTRLFRADNESLRGKSGAST